VCSSDLGNALLSTLEKTHETSQYFPG